MTIGGRLESNQVTPQPNWRDRQRAVREEAILEATSELLAEQGYSAMSMDEVANRVGISKATLYQHFPSKEELAVHTIERRVQNIITYIKELDPALPAIERLEMVAGRSLQQRYSKQRLDMNVTQFMPPHLLKEHPKYQQTHRQIEAAMMHLIDEAKAQGDVGDQYPTSIIAQMFFSCIRDANYEMMIRTGMVTPQTLTETLMAIFFNGIRKRS